MTKQVQTVTGGSLALQAGGNITFGDIIIKRDATRSDVAEIVKVILAEMVKDSPNLLRRIGGDRGAKPSAEADINATLRAQLAEARLDKETVSHFLHASSALEQELRIAESFGSKRLFALDGAIVVRFMDRGADYPYSRETRSAEFMHRDVPAYFFSMHTQRAQVCLSARASRKIYAYLAHRYHPSALLSVDEIALTKRTRQHLANSDFVALRDLISWKSEPDERLVLETERKVLMATGDRRVKNAVVDYTIDIAEVIAANRNRPHDGAYVSFVTPNLELPVIDVSRDLHPRYDSSRSPIQNAYGPAWRHYLEQSDSESDVARLRFVPGACNLARELLADPTAWRADKLCFRSEEAGELMESIQELLRIVEPFNASIIADIQSEKKEMREEIEKLVRDLLSGGELIEKMLLEYIWLGVELRRSSEQSADSDETGEQENFVVT